ncbi:hypothetical protein NDU88_008336 [Pleurodeles waltl]|uniref:Uncharacterized protein n=1 Tax=Pleurodeles waltl TaxID=8319 RepID=A0AAV7PRU7_PLEWA|nr:hypothetical protein NDU88_008336 [Pleurodeles waltl]
MPRRPSLHSANATCLVPKSGTWVVPSPTRSLTASGPGAPAPQASSPSAPLAFLETQTLLRSPPKAGSQPPVTVSRSATPTRSVVSTSDPRRGALKGEIRGPDGAVIYASAILAKLATPH